MPRRARLPLLGCGWLAGVLAVVLGQGLALAQGALSALDTDVEKIAKTARPSVVTVFAQAVPARPSRGTDRERPHTRIGSGVAVAESWIVTTASVVQGATRVWIRTTNDLQVEARVAGVDPVFNVAVLHVPDVKLPPLGFVEAAPREGEWVMAIGTSHHRARITQTVGTVAFRHQDARFSMVQLTNSVYPGYSGGAVLNARGQLVGLVYGELGPDQTGNSGYDLNRGGGSTFVLLAETVQPVYDLLRREGRVRHGYMGVSTRAASVESGTGGERVPIGALVENVQPGSPGARLGLVRGDLIVGFDRERVEYPEQLARWVAATRPGTPVDFVWVRNEIQQVGRVVVSESPEAVPQWAKLPAPPEGVPQTLRIADIEREIQRLNRELERLKSGSVTTPH